MVEHLTEIYRYYPKYIHPTDINYSYTPECIEQWKLIEKLRENNLHFERMLEVMSEQLRCENYQDFSLRGIFDLCYKAILFLPDNSSNSIYPYCVINISAISKYYFIYFTKFAGEPINTINTGFVNTVQNNIGLNISKVINTYYPGYKPFLTQNLNLIVPEVFSASKYDQYATYFECLLTNDIF